MKNRFVKITLILTMLLVMAVPTQAFAAEKNCTQTQTNPTNNQINKIYSQLSYGALPQFQGAKLSTLQLQELLKQMNLKATAQGTKVQTPAAEKTAAPAQTAPAPAKNTPAPAPAKPATPAAPTTPAKPTTPTTPAAPATSAIGAYEQQVVELVNKERAAAGLPTLKINTELSKVAETKAADLRDNQYFDHTSPVYGSPFDMMKQFGISYTAAGENIAKGQTTPAEVMEGWMNSPGHRANILNEKFTEIGVGYVTDSNGTAYWVQQFIRP